MTDTNEWTYLFSFVRGLKQADIFISNGLSEEYLVCFMENNQAKNKVVSVDRTSAYEMAEGFVMGRCSDDR